jgi:hypothetical protein
MHIVVLLKLCLIDPLLAAKAICVLILHENAAASGRAGNNRVHNNDVGFHQIVGKLCAARIHKQGRDHNDESTADQEADVLVCKQTVLVGFVYLENSQYLAVAQSGKRGVQLPELFDVDQLYLLHDELLF